MSEQDSVNQQANENGNPADYVQWFRNSSPYINAHRGRTFVVLLPGEAVASENLHTIIHDLALLHSLGIRLVLVHGARKQISERLAQRQHATDFNLHTRITDETALETVTEAVGAIRLKLEGLFSMGLANSPMHNASIDLVSGNFVVAKPVGVQDGHDYQHTGEVRKIQTAAINRQLENGGIVLLSPIGCSPTGELFNLNSEEVASTCAIALKADKLILMGQSIRDDQQHLVREINPQIAGKLLANNSVRDAGIERQLTAACLASSNGVPRAHLVDYSADGALLRELFTRDGCGTLVTQESYETIRAAHIEDVGGILELISPLEASGVLVRRSRELLENEIHHFLLIERDGMVIGCAALYPFDQQTAGELACVAVHPAYQKGKRGEALLEQIERRAAELGMKDIFVLTTRTAHWFQEQGFIASSIDALPKEKQELYNYQRNSKVFRKTL